MLLPNVYFDEAGNTGPNLLDSNQPVFVLASNCFNAEQANDLLSIVQTPQAREVKFQTLKKGQSGRNKILDFFKQELITPEYISTTIIHKGIMGVGQITEILVEPLYDKKGINFYEHYRNIAFTNRLWFCIGGFYGKECLNEVIYKFCQMIKSKSDESASDFYEYLKYLKTQHPKNKYGNIFDEILATEPFITEFLENITSASIDPVQNGIFAHSVFWGKKFVDGFNIIHDDSNTLRTSLENFNRFTNPNLKLTQIGNDERAFQIPLKTQSVSFEDSKELAQLQISDLVASSTAYVAKARANNVIDDFANNLIDIGIDKFVNIVVWPDKDCLDRAKDSIARNNASPVNPMNVLVKTLINHNS